MKRNAAMGSRLTSSTPRQQRGFAVLAIGLILLGSLTFITLYAARAGLMEQQISANERRHKQAFAMAEAGVEQTIGYINENRRLIRSNTGNGWLLPAALRWQPCDSNDVTIPCGDGTTNLFGTEMLAYTNVGTNANYDDGHIDIPQNAVGNDAFTVHMLTRSDAGAPAEQPLITIVAEGTSDDGTAQSIVQQGTYFFPFKARTPDAPLIAAGTISGSGTFDIVTNPDGAGPGVALSVWASGDLTISGAIKTCQLGDHLLTGANQSATTDASGNPVTLCTDCDCDAPADTLTDSAIENYDILDIDGNVGVSPDTTNFPADLFQYVFGIPEADWRTVKDQATVLADCSTIDATATGLYWVEGDCSLSGTAGSYAEPLLLVVEGDTSANAQLEFFGLLFQFDPTGATHTVRLNGGPIVYGAIIANQQVDLANGNFTMRYDRGVLEYLWLNVAGRALSKVPGTWADYL